MAQREAAFTIARAWTERRRCRTGSRGSPCRRRWKPRLDLIDGKVVFRNRLEPVCLGADGRDETQQKRLRTGYLVVVALTGAHRFHRPCAAREQRRRRVIATKPSSPAFCGRRHLLPRSRERGAGAFRARFRATRSALLERSEGELSARPRSCRPVDDERGPTVRRACSADRLLDQERLRRRPSRRSGSRGLWTTASHASLVIGTQREPR